MMTPTRLANAVTTLSQGLGRKGAIWRIISGITDGSQAVTLLVTTWEHASQQVSNASSTVDVRIIDAVLLRNLIEQDYLNLLC